MTRRKTKKQKHIDYGVEEIFTASMERRRNIAERWADGTADSFGTLAFLVINCLVFVTWIVWNLGYIPEATIFDPFPFNLLTMVVSLEAIILSTIVLISQNRAAKIADIREEIDLQVNLRAERQISEVLRILDKLEHKMHVTHLDNQWLADMEKPIDLKKLEKQMSKKIR